MSSIEGEEGLGTRLGNLPIVMSDTDLYQCTIIILAGKNLVNG